MCIAYPGTVVEVSPEGALVDTGGRLRRASVLLEPATAVGDAVVVSGGAVIRILDPAEADDMRALLDEATRADAAAAPVDPASPAQPPEPPAHP
jgi:hydrogenase assembly chaperone HypC/HupF